MAAQQAASPFPPPPEFAENYSDDNIRAGLVLAPPPIPSKFTVYNEEYDLEGPLLQSLSELNIQQLYSSSANWKSELKKLNRSVVAAFLDLIEILIQSADHPDRLEKVESIRLLFINMHHLINEYRPIQARDTLRQMIIRQNQEIRNVTMKLLKYIETGNEAVSSLKETLQKLPFDDSIPTPPASSIMNELKQTEALLQQTQDSENGFQSTSLACTSQTSPAEQAIFLKVVTSEKEKEFLDSYNRQLKASLQKGKSVLSKSIQRPGNSAKEKPAEKEQVEKMEVEESRAAVSTSFRGANSSSPSTSIYSADGSRRLQDDEDEPQQRPVFQLSGSGSNSDEDNN